MPKKKENQRWTQRHGRSVTFADDFDMTEKGNATIFFGRHLPTDIMSTLSKQIEGEVEVFHKQV
jgi:hypothetical protein